MYGYSTGQKVYYGAIQSWKVMFASLYAMEASTDPHEYQLWLYSISNLIYIRCFHNWNIQYLCNTSATYGLPALKAIIPK